MSSNRISRDSKWSIALRYLTASAIEPDDDRRREGERLKATLERNAYRAFQPAELDIAVAALAAGLGGRKLTGIQVGANHGMDGLRHLFHGYFSRLVLVEPQARLIPELKANYAECPAEVTFENLAIGADGGELVLHIPDDYAEARRLELAGRSASFIVGTNRDLTLRVLRNRCKLSAEDAERHLVATHIPAISIERLAEKHGLTDLDFLQIDCEGYDWHAIRSMGAMRPRIINFESKLLSPEDWTAWVDFAAANDYGYIVCKTDTLAIRGARFRLA
jgi:FkbM family methyltransferase